MTAHGHAHPHALAGTLRAPAGMPLPALASVDVPRGHDGWRGVLDIIGGVAFATLIGIMCMRVGGSFFSGRGWAPVIGWESVWLMAAILCSPLMPSGIRHDISWRSTFEGLKLDWPELMYATWVLGMYAAWLGEIRLEAGPIGLALAVGTAEEFIFRVLLLGWLVSRMSAPGALAVSSVVFGLAHLHEASIAGILAIVPQTAGGFILGAIYLRTRNPIAPILAHAYWDFPYFMALGFGVSGGAPEKQMPGILDLAPWLAFILYGIWLVRHGVPLVGRVDPVGCACEPCSLHPRAAPQH